MEMREVREQSSDAGEERRVKDEEEGSRRWKRGQEEIDEVTEMEGGRKICYRHIPEDCGHSGDSCSMCLLDRVCVTEPVQGRFCWQDVDQLYACVCVCVRVEPRDSGGFTSDPSTPRQTSDKMRKEGEGRRESRINAEEAKRERKSEERGCKWGRKWSESKDDRRRRRSEGGGGRKSVLSRSETRGEKQDMNAWRCWRSAAESEGSRVKECSQVKVIRRTYRVVSLSPPVAPCVALPLSPFALLGRLTLPFMRLTRSQKGGWIEEWRGVKERGRKERRREDEQQTDI